MAESFWDKLPKSFCGLAPMDGVTDYLYRHIMREYGQPDFMVTEFTSVEGIAHNALKLLRDFEYTEDQRPIVAQVFGIEPDSFYITAIIVCEMGFDGIDINMGCPAKKVKSRGAGAALIANPELASEIIKATQEGVKDFVKGKRIKDLKLKNKMKEAIYKLLETHNIEASEKEIPVSVKTRIGYESVVVEDWASHLLSHNIAALTIHGRTLNQMYSGEACWESIGKVAKIGQDFDTVILGNGDVRNRKDAEEKCEKYGVDGVLIGRATFGNPWVFKNIEPTMKQRVELALYHCQKFEELYGTDHFYVMRKHLGWYIRGMSGAREFRKELMLVNSTEEVKGILEVLK